MALLEVRGLHKRFPVDGGRSVHAVNGVDLAIARGETHGLVGESGSGKSTVGRLMLRLIDPDGGSARFADQDLFAARGAALRALRRRMGLIYQDPASSLDPRWTARDLVAEPWAIARMFDAAERRRRAEALLQRVGLDPAQSGKRPGAFSGGQLQRIGIARALALEPDLVICDEPVSALDVSVQGQILNLLRELQVERGLAYLFIAHDLGVVRHLSDRVSVMLLGRIVESGTRDEVFERPSHPYTQALLAAAHPDDPTALQGRVLPGEPPRPTDTPSGCDFRTRCPFAQAICAEEVPQLVDRGQGHPAACHFSDRSAPSPTAAAVTPAGG